MRVLNEREKLLSNLEVFEHLNEIQAQNNWKQNDNRKHKRSFNPDLETVTGEVVSYLSKNQTTKLTTDELTLCMRALAKFQLEKIERLQIINSAPHSMVNLYSIVEECDQRFNEHEVQEILDIVQQYFPQEEAAEEAEDEEAVDELEGQEDQDVEMA